MKYGRTHYARKTSAIDNLTDIMRLSLSCSDPMFAEIDVRSEPRKVVKDEAFEACMAYYVIDESGDESADTGNSETDEDEEFEESSSSDYDSSDDDSN